VRGLRLARRVGTRGFGRSRGIATLGPFEVGHYRIEYAVDPSSMPPIGGEFDVNPG
jgi:hypothetical protein